MLLKILVVISIFIVGLEADYLTHSQTNLAKHSDYKIKFKDANNEMMMYLLTDNTLRMDADNVDIPLFNRDLVYSGKDLYSANDLAGLFYGTTEDDFGRNVAPNIAYYDYANLILHLLFNKPVDNRLIVEKQDIFYKVSIKHSTKRIFSVLDNKIVSAGVLDVYASKAQKLVGEDRVEGQDFDKSMFRLYTYKHNIIAIEVLDDKNDLHLYKVVQVESPILDTFKIMDKNNPEHLTSLDFSKEPITAKYLFDDGNSQKRLTYKISMIGKKHNIIKVYLKGNSIMFDPDSKINTIQESQAYLFNVKNGRKLFEIKGKKVIASDEEFSILNSPKMSFIKVKYINSNGENDKKEYSKSSRAYYNTAGMWYLLQWMHQYSKNEENIMLFFNSSTPRDFDVSAQDGFVTITRGGRDIFYATMSNIGLVKSFSYAKTKIKLILEDATTPTILENRKKLEKYKKDNDIKWIIE